MKSTFKIFFYLKKTTPRTNGCVPIMGRITIDGKFVQFSTKLEISPALWNQRTQRANIVKGSSAEAANINERLTYITSRMLELYRELQEQDLYVTAEKVKNAFMGHTIREHTLLSLFRQHLDNLEKVKGVTISPATVQKYDRTYRHLAEFLKAEYRVSDIALCEINHMFITDWERYLRTKCNCGANTTAKFMQSFRMIVLMARNNGWLIGDPFANYKIKLEKVDRGYLTKEEIRRIAEKEFVCKRLEQVRDIFLFSCFTGLAYIDAKALTEDDIRPGFDDRLWIMTKRVKTNTDVRVPLLDFPLSILQKYKGKQAFKRVLPVLSNQKMNAYLKEIADVCGIQKNLTFHLARHTFATTITLSNGVPIETVSKMLGHTNIETTQIYARVVNEKMSHDMNNLATKLGNMQVARG